MKEDQDGAEPASNSVAAMNLLRLASLLDKEEHRTKAGKIFEAFAERLGKIPLALPEMTSALTFKPTQIILTGEGGRKKTVLCPLIKSTRIVSIFSGKPVRRQASNLTQPHTAASSLH
jgi:uncharacterized protein YyaL (SSP411 family)